LAEQFDYIIAGAGLAGLSLLQHMMQHAFFRHKRILVLDKAAKKSNDRTWCFWEQQAGPFEPVVHHRWDQIDFYSRHFSARYDTAPYTYKMIRSADLYRHVLQQAADRPGIWFVNTTIISITDQPGQATVTTSNGTFAAPYVFSSVLWNTPAPHPKRHHLLQHFRGWFIETEQPVFNQRQATFMDFRVIQRKAATFMYVLPTAPNRALVEYTLFSGQVLPEEDYETALQEYINHFVTTKFTVLEKEAGIIPMTNQAFSSDAPHIVHLGTAGNQTKASSGYTFRFVQKHCSRIIAALVSGSKPTGLGMPPARFRYYDSVFLNVLARNQPAADEVFARLFKGNDPATIFRFLDNESSLRDDLAIIRSVRSWPFVRAGMQELFSAVVS
jgi:lycopene beta-cyclase